MSNCRTAAGERDLESLQRARVTVRHRKRRIAEVQGIPISTNSFFGHKVIADV